MRPEGLHSFITLLEEADELRRIDCLVDPFLEVATIIDRVSKGAGGGRALLFSQVKGSDLPLAANLFGSRQRVGWALGTVDLKGLAERLARDLRRTGQPDSTAALRELVDAPQWQPVVEEEAPCFAVDLTAGGFDALPVMHCWPADGGPYLTLGQVFTRDPQSGLENCGMYRIQVIDKQTAAIRCHPGSGAGQHLDAWRAAGESMPVAIVLGGPPILTWAAGVPLPDRVMEAAFVGYLSDRPLRLVKCRASGLSIPATAEIVIAGTVDPGRLTSEGPFGNHTGRYVPPVDVPVFHLERLTTCKGAIYPTTLVGPPPMEDIHLAEVTERLLLPLLQHDHPWVRDIHMPPQGIFHRGAIVQVDRGCGLSKAALADALWRSLLLKNARLLVLCGPEADLRDPADVYWRLINAEGWTSSLLVDDQKLVVDAREPAGAPAVKAEPAVLERVLGRWREYGLD